MGIFDFFKGSQNNNFEHLKEFPKFVTDEESEGLDKTIDNYLSSITLESLVDKQKESYTTDYFI